MATITTQRTGTYKTAFTNKLFPIYTVSADDAVIGETNQIAKGVWVATNIDYTFSTREKAIEALVEAYEAAQAADIAAEYELAEVAERIAVEEAAPAALPIYTNIEINKRMAINAASLFDMQSLQNFARCMPINAEITAKNGDVYFLWGASEFPAYMAEDGSAEIWAFPNSRPCRWLSISLGDAPRPAFVPERDDEDAAAEFWREHAIPF